MPPNLPRGMAFQIYQAWRMRCKDYFRAQKFFEYLSLSGDPEQRGDKRRLPSCIAFR
jgi:hypothetical protein